MPRPPEDPGSPGRLLQIGEVAERVGLSLRTVRFYEEAGLITPATRSEGNFRLYVEDHIERLLVIKEMKPLGFTIEQMRGLLAAQDQLADPSATIEDRTRAGAQMAQFAALADERSAKLRATAGRGVRFAAELRKTAADSTAR